MEDLKDKLNKKILEVAEQVITQKLAESEKRVETKLSEAAEEGRKKTDFKAQIGEIATLEEAIEEIKAQSERKIAESEKRFSEELKKAKEEAEKSDLRLQLFATSLVESLNLTQAMKDAVLDQNASSTLTNENLGNLKKELILALAETLKVNIQNEKIKVELAEPIKFPEIPAAKEVNLDSVNSNLRTLDFAINKISEQLTKLSEGLKVLDNLSVKISNDRPNESIPVRLSDGEKFINAIQQTTEKLVGGGGGYVDYMGSRKVLNALTRGQKVIQRVNSGDANIVYIGIADAGTATSAAKWRVIRETRNVSGNANQQTVELADGDDKYDNIFDNRESLTYS